MSLINVLHIPLSGLKVQSLFFRATYGQSASTLVAGSALETTVQQLLDMGGGNWDRETVVRALRAAFNNPERAVEYLYSVSDRCEVHCALLLMFDW